MSATLPVLDPVTVGSLQVTLPLAVREQLVELLSTGTPETITAMREACHDGDAEALKSLAHRCKGGSLTLGAARMGDICARLERMAEGRELVESGAEIDRLAVAALEAEIALREQLLEL